MTAAELVRLHLRLVNDVGVGLSPKFGIPNAHGRAWLRDFNQYRTTYAILENDGLDPAAILNRELGYILECEIAPEDAPRHNNGRAKDQDAPAPSLPDAWAGGWLQDTPRQPDEPEAA